MIPPYGIIYQYEKPIRKKSYAKSLGIVFLLISFFGILIPVSQRIRLETQFLVKQTAKAQRPNLPPAVPVVFNPLTDSDGSLVTPVNRDFSLIIPKIGVNANVIPDVDPGNPAEYAEALEHGVAHARTSFLPNQDGTVYLFSHSTNYDWFAKDLNAIFYLLKNLDTGDTIVLYYKGVQYTYRLSMKKVVSPTEISYLVGQSGKKNLILQTCWPPGSTTERLLIFADLITEQGQSI